MPPREGQEVGVADHGLEDPAARETPEPLRRAVVAEPTAIEEEQPTRHRLEVAGSRADSLVVWFISPLL